MFSITTSADGIILLTVGGEEAVGTASVTAFLLVGPAGPARAGRVAGHQADASRTAAARLADMGVTRIALAPVPDRARRPTRRPSRRPRPLWAPSAAAPLGAHGNVIKLISQAYGQVLGQLETLDAA